MKRFAFIFTILTLIAVSAYIVFSQTKRNQRTTKVEVVPTQTPKPTPEPERTPTKRNNRPGSEGIVPETKSSSFVPKFTYEFTRPGFIYSKITITHDDKGQGTITFEKKDLDESFTDPIKVSPATIEQINTALDELDFFNSNENYQYEKDYSHLGTAKFTFLRGDKKRSTQFNWTDNKAAKIIADIYRKLSNQYTWQFEINVSRENQPLQSPSIIDTLDSYLRRNEIADPRQMIPFLKELHEDDRLPLMSRNHVDRLIKQIEKIKD